MFKRIEIWILYLVVLLGIPVTIGFGSVVRHEILGGTKLGRISETSLFFAELPSKIRVLLRNKIDLEVKDRFTLLDGFNGTPNSYESYLLLSRYDGDKKKGIVELVDLRNFKVLHTWNPDIDEFNKLLDNNEDFKFLKRDNNRKRTLVKHPLLLKDGGLLFQHKSPTRKIDACSNLIFQTTNNISHHSIETDIDGNIWIPNHIYPQSLPIEKVGREIVAEGGFKDDAIVKLTPDGKILFEKSVSQILIDNGLEFLLFAIRDWKFIKDPIHLNDIQPVDFDGEFWKKGDLFLSLRNQSMVMLYRPSTNKIIWSGTGPFFNQHDVDILNDHKISVFNNNVKSFSRGNIVDGSNEIIIFNFKKNEYSFYHNDSLIKNDVRTISNGRSQILPNGDFFVEETIYGRSLYFNSDGSLKWTHVNRADNSKVYRVGWSRILYDKKDLNIVKNFLKSRGECNN